MHSPRKIKIQFFLRTNVVCSKVTAESLGLRKMERNTIEQPAFSIEHYFKNAVRKFQIFKIIQSPKLLFWGSENPHVIFEK